MIRINLLGTERPTQKKKAASAAAPGALQAYLLLGLFVGGAAVACTLAYLWKAASIRDLESKIKEAEATKTRLQAIKVQVDAFQAKKDLLQRKIDLIEKLQADKTGPVHMLDEISKSLPDFVWLSNLDQAGPTVKFTGQSNSLTSVADFISALQRTGWFPQVDLVSSTQQENIVSFVLQASFQNAEAVAKQKAAQAAQAQQAASQAAAGASPAPQKK